MQKWNQAIAIMCIAGLLPFPCAAEHRSGSALDVQGLVNEFGPGADVKVKLGDGRTVRGQVRTIQSEGFHLISPHKPSSFFRYQEVVSLRLANRVYRSGKERDIEAARRVAFALGPGHHVLTRIRTGKTYRGHIDTVSSAGFMLRLDHTGQSVPISYTDVDHLEQNLSRAAKIGIVAAAAGVVALIIIFRKIEYDD